MADFKTISLIKEGNKSNYSARYGFDFGTIEVPFHPELNVVVTVPVQNEPNLVDLLESLQHTHTSEPVLVILIFNCSEDDSIDLKEAVRRDFETFKSWQKLYDESDHPICFVGMLFDLLPKKHAGVGLARKIAMDLASNILELSDSQDGLIVGLDGDCTVSKNYFQEIQAYFRKHPKIRAASIYFEHPITGPVLGNSRAEAIVTYELYLRYHVNALNFFQAPWGFQTVGSSMVVRSLAYTSTGGMNRRKAAEDFYFLTKYMDGKTFGEIKACQVFPSGRVSDRVPFGTGKAVNEIQHADGNYAFYSLKAYQDLGIIYGSLENWYQKGVWSQDNFGESKPGRAFWKYECLAEKWNQALTETKTFDTFRSKFLQSFSPLKALQFLKASSKEHKAIDLQTESRSLLERLDPELTARTGNDQRSLLMSFRAFDQNAY